MKKIVLAVVLALGACTRGQSSTPPDAGVVGHPTPKENNHKSTVGVSYSGKMGLCLDESCTLQMHFDGTGVGLGFGL